MKTIRNVLAGGMIALAAGFVGGELLGPTATSAASSSCPMQICYNLGTPAYCAASAAEVWCDYNDFLGTCSTEDCEEPCDPASDPMCEPD